MSWLWAVAYVLVGIFFAEMFLAWSRRERGNTRGTETGGYFIAICLWPLIVFYLLRPSRRS